MFEKEVNRYLEWVAENLPIVAMRESDEVRRIVKLAINETRIIRIVLRIGGAVFGIFIGIWFMGTWFDDSVSSMLYTVMLAICAGAVTYVTAIAGDVLVHRKIESLANAA